MFIHVEDGVKKARVGKYIVYNAEWFKEHFEQERALYGKEGEWIVSGDFIHCSECGYEPPVIDCYDYCNCCGAKMKLPEPLSPSEILYRQASHFVPPTDSGLRQRKEEE